MTGRYKPPPPPPPESPTPDDNDLTVDFEVNAEASDSRIDGLALAASIIFVVGLLLLFISCTVWGIVSMWREII